MVVEIARWCLNGESQSEVSHVEYEYKDSTYHFEYPLSEPTAHLLVSISMYVIACKPLIIYSPKLTSICITMFYHLKL